MRYLTILMLLSLWACKPSEQVQRKRANDFFNAHPAEIANRCAEQFPPKVTPGKVITKSDTTYLPGQVLPCDTVRLPGEVKYVRCPPEKIIRDTIHRTDTVENIARIYALQARTDSLNISLIQTKEQKSFAEKSAKRSRNLFIGALGAFLLILAGLAFIKLRL